MNSTVASARGARKSDEIGRASYVHGLRARPQAWRAILATFAGLLALGVALVLSIPLGGALDNALGGATFDPEEPRITVGFWIMGNVLLAALTPVAALLQWAIYRVRPQWIVSVAGRFRWRVLARAAVWVLPIWVVYLLILQLFLPTGALQLSSVTLTLALVAVITVPLQSAGEEFLFRGLIFRAIGARFARPAIALAVATTITALQFAAIHGAADGWTFVYYAVTGICLALMAQATGGLEVPILVHATNNTLLLVPTILAGQLESLSTVTGPIVLLPITVLLAVTAIIGKRSDRLTGSPA